jgi:hypothetical protein
MLIISQHYLVFIKGMLFSMNFITLLLPARGINRSRLHHAQLGLTLHVYSLNIPDIPCHSGPCPKGKK